MKIKAVLFDVGGTIHNQHYNEELKHDFASRVIKLLNENGFNITDSPEVFAEKLTNGAKNYKTHSEQSLKELPCVEIWGDWYLKDYSLDKGKLLPIAEGLCDMYDGQRSKIVMRPELNEAVDSLDENGFRMGIISNITSHNFVPNILKKYNISDKMEVVVMSSVTGIRKPDPEIFYIAAKEMGLHPEEIAYIGDTISRDVLGVRRSNTGLIICIMPDVVKEREKFFESLGYKPDYTITKLTEILDIVENYNNKKLP